MDLEGHWLVTLALVSSSLIATTANFLLVLVFLRRRGLRTASNRFVINLLFINLVSSLLLVPFLIVDKEATGARRRLEEFNVSEAEIVESSDKEFILEKVSRYANGTLYESLLIENRSADADDLEIIQANFSVDLSGDAALDTLCAVSQFSLNFICTASILSILLIGIDQYVAVLHPLRSHSYINKSKSLVLIIISWLISGSFASVTAALSTNGSFFMNICVPTAQTTANRIFAVAYFLLVILLPFLTICLIYVLIYNAAHKNSSRIRKSTNNTQQQQQQQQEESTAQQSPPPATKTAKSAGGVSGFPKVHSAPNLNKVNEMRELKPTKSVTMTRTHSERPPPRRLISSLKTRISNASVFRYREENRTAKISILVIFMVLVCYVPYGILYIANTASTQLRVFNQVSLVLLISSNLLSPILFAYRNRRVQRELKKYLKGFMRDSMGTNPGGAKPQIVVNHITNRSEVDVEDVDDEDGVDVIQPFLSDAAASSHQQQHQTSCLSAPRCTVELEKKSILKRVCSKNWSSYKKCSFIAVPDSCLDARGSFSSASTQISTED